MELRNANGRPRLGGGAVLAVLLLGAGACTEAARAGDTAPEVEGAAAQAPDMEVMKGYLIDAFERAKAWDVSLAQAIPDSALGWAPSPDVRGFAAQVVHAANNGFVGGPMFGESAPAMGVDEGSVPDKAALVAAVTGTYDWILAKLRAMPAAQLGAEAEFFGGRVMPRWRIALFALEHAMWTRGQLVPYLHAHGVSVPQQRLF